MPTRLWRSPFALLRSGAPHGSGRQRLEAAVLRMLVRSRRPSLIYANTAAVGPQVSALQALGTPVLWHIHELPYALQLCAAAAGQPPVAAAARVIAVSDAVAEALASGFGVARDRIDVIHGFVADAIGTDAARRAARERVRKSLGWPIDAFVVGACGGPGWRKGSDLFLQVARRLIDARRAAPWRFLWVGGDGEQHPESLQFSHDLRRLGLQDACHRVQATRDVHDHYAAMDVFALPSREDPFPLVMLEAGAHGLPTVCFAEAGGGAEFTAAGAGVSVPYLDLAAFAAAIDGLRLDPARLEALGQRARQLVATQHTLDAKGPRVLQSIEQGLLRGVLAGAAASRPASPSARGHECST